MSNSNLSSMESVDDYLQSMVNGTMKNINESLQPGKLGKQSLKGGNIFASRDAFENVIKHTKSSENAVMSELKNIISACKKYINTYDKHLDNLHKLDVYIKFNGMTEMFKRVILKQILSVGVVDKNLELLFNNYSINTQTTEADFIKQHFVQQIYYIISKYFSDKGGMINIKYIFILTNTKTHVSVHVTNKEDISETHEISHSNYILNEQEAFEKLQNIIIVDKSKLKHKKADIKFDDDNKHNTQIDPILSILTDPESLSKYKKISSMASSNRTYLKQVDENEVIVVTPAGTQSAPFATNKAASVKRSAFKIYARKSSKKTLKTKSAALPAKLVFAPAPIQTANINLDDMFKESSKKTKNSNA